MPQFAVNTHRFDPYKNFKFRVKWDGRYVAGVSKVYRCWVSEYQALPDLDANANSVAIETITLENEGWERDHEVTEPAEPAFDVPPE